MNPAQSAIKRAHRDLGRTFEVTNFEYNEDGGSNPYADGDWVPTETLEVNGTIAYPGGERDPVQDASGPDVAADATIYLLPDEAPIRRGTSDESRATELVDTVSNKTYRVVDTDRHRNVLAIHVEEE